MNKERKAMLALYPGDYIVGMWCFDVPPAIHPPAGGDVMVTLYRKASAAPDRWTILHRHRYTHPTEVGVVKFADSKDRLSGYHYEISGAEDEVRTKVTSIVMMMAATAGINISQLEDTYFDIRGGGEKMHALAMEGKAPRWLNLQSVSSTPQ